MENVGHVVKININDVEVGDLVCSCDSLGISVRYVLKIERSKISYLYIDLKEKRELKNSLLTNFLDDLILIKRKKI